MTTTTRTAPDHIVFLLDCDNTLLDNDQVNNDLRDHLSAEFGVAGSDRYFAILEQMSTELGYVDYLGALQRYRLCEVSNPHMLLMASFLLEYPFATRLYPGALDLVRQFRNWGLTVILSDGDGIVAAQDPTIRIVGSGRGKGSHLPSPIHGPI